MPGNKHLLQDRSKILKNKLSKLTNSLQGGLGNTTLQTKEQYLFEAIKALGQFYKSLNEPQIELEEINQVRVDDLPDADLFNLIWNEILDDLTIVFSELENVESIAVANFNYLTTESNRLTARLKSVSSKLGDFILYSLNPSRDAFFFKDSFNDLSKIDINSGLLNAPQCEINQAEGIITLPIDRSVDSRILIKETPIINPNSNGVVGNNQELNVPFNGDLSVLLDSNPDTWFEFERVVVGLDDDKVPLVLDLTINLGQETVINHIRVNPNNFGTKTVIQIDEIETSIDGQVYTSIKDDVPIAGFSTQDEENIFSLAPSTSKFAGQGIYTFTPRKVKYVRFVFRQTEPYTIATNNGERLRYAIGLRDIDILGYAYQSTGELISKPFESISEIRKVVLSANQNPSQLSELTEIQYSVSPNDGATWYRIQPSEFQGPVGIESVPEVLNFNSIDDGSITTSVPVNSLRLKARLVRNDTAFVDGSSTFNKTTEAKAEVHGVPRESPFNIELEESPVDGTIQVIDPLFGSRGLPEAPYILGHAMDKIDLRTYRLPFTDLPRPIKKVLSGGAWHTEPVPASEWVHIAIGGEEWEQATQPLSSYTIDFNNLGNYKKYNLDINKKTLSFGDGLTNTLSPPSDQPVALWFDAERLFPSATENDHIAPLEFATSNNKDDMTIKRYDIIKETTELIPRKATIIRLSQENLVDITGIQGVFGGGNQQTFVNGKEELSSSAHWSIDTEAGIIYLKTPTSGTADVSVSYTYQPIYTLTTDDWDWATTNILRDSVSIKDTAWKTITIEEETLPTTSGLKSLDVSKFSLVKGTLVLDLEENGGPLADSSQNPFAKEVDFVNGVEELGGQVRQTIENIATGLTSAASGIVSFALKENISTDSAHKVSFSNSSSFSNEVGSLASVVANGDWFVERDPGGSGGGVYGTVYVMVDDTPNSGTELVSPGKITYYYTAPEFSDNGLYSVDYANGKIYTQRSLDPDNLGTWTLTATYQYTDFRAEYKIARVLDPNHYDVDVTEATITLKDAEVLKYLQIPHSLLNNLSPVYIVTYDRIVETREDISDLVTKFSPVIKDYALRILTKGNLF